MQLLGINASLLLYGLEACPLTKSDLSAVDFVVNCFFMKLFDPIALKLSKAILSLITELNYYGLIE